MVSEPGYANIVEQFLSLIPMNLARIVFMRDGPDAGIPAMVAAYAQAGCNRCGLDAIGMAYDQAGRYPEAIDSYERFVSLPDPFAFLVMGRMTPVHFRLGELYEEAGDIDRALVHYSRFAELWEKADAELQPRVGEARRRIESLRNRNTREP